ncbi:MAG TPA: hypothetical protein VFE10_15210 [Phenylobacterium sp.]|nr:hypothetical protein [Phenylobacterium sp.]
MARHRWTRAVAAAIAALTALPGLGHSQPASEPRPSAGLTKAQAAEWFYLDVARCLYSREHDGGVADLTPQAKANLRPALPSERFMFKDRATRVWTSDLYGAHVLLAELGPDRCEVVADRLPVDATFRDVVARLHKAGPALRDDSVKPDLADRLSAGTNSRGVPVHRPAARLGARGHGAPPADA